MTLVCSHQNSLSIQQKYMYYAKLHMNVQNLLDKNMKDKYFCLDSIMFELFNKGSHSLEFARLDQRC